MWLKFSLNYFKEREEWVHAIEQQILSSLQCNETNKLKVISNFRNFSIYVNKIIIFLFKSKNGGLAADNLTILTMKSVPGNTTCADCDAPSKSIFKKEDTFKK